MNNFIVYALIDTTRPGVWSTPYVSFLYLPYYIGKGKDENRPKTHYYETLTRSSMSTRPSHKNNKILKLHEAGVRFEYVTLEVATEDRAYEVEEELINILGRRSEGGVLTNIAEGGTTNSKAGYIHCKDDQDVTVYVRIDDPRIGKELVPMGRRGNVPCYDQNGNFIYVPKALYDPLFHRHVHQDAKRSEETRQKISAGKKKYKFTDEHRANIAEVNRKKNLIIHKGAQRKNSTKQAIAKSRFGSKSKVAKIWKLVGPKGELIVYRGGLVLGADLFGLCFNRLKRYEGSSVPYPDYSGHKQQKHFNTTGWKLEQIDDPEEINFIFVFFSE